MFRLQFSRCLSQRGSYALRQSTGVTTRQLRTSAVALRQPTQTRGLATVAPNEPPVHYPFSHCETSANCRYRQLIRFSRGMQAITLTRCMQHGEKTLLASMFLGMYLILIFWLYHEFS